MRWKFIIIHKRKHLIRKLKAVYPDLRAPALNKEAENCTFTIHVKNLRAQCNHQTPPESGQKLPPNHRAHRVPNFASSSFIKERRSVSSSK